ncbi:hypothetical protein [Aminobacter sp. AP02]|uniref:hypothetical protein n=1 Tax=Aminobacter sp. AP02 TaxID=2135737 RepID=UPI000D6D0573|nr:hypothetical protein [Aminobacter sp. AP02]PWK64921.1 hypothetical protein C8K44_11818 [Aminobacter sp. AP02]
MTQRLATLVAIIVVSLAASPAAGVEASRGRTLLTDPHQHNLATLYQRWPNTAADYVTAMMRYRDAAEYEELPPKVYPFIMSYGRPLGGPWTWTAPNGSHVRRLRDGSLRISMTDQLGNWFVDILCTDTGWPVFSCSDGIERVAAAPIPQVLVIDGVEFSRTLPPPTEPWPTPQDGEAAEP